MKRGTIVLLVWSFIAMTMIMCPIIYIAGNLGFSPGAAFISGFLIWFGVQLSVGITEYQWGDSSCLTDDELAMAERQAQFASDRLYIKLTQECRRLRK